MWDRGWHSAAAVEKQGLWRPLLVQCKAGMCLPLHLVVPGPCSALVLAVWGRKTCPTPACAVARLPEHQAPHCSWWLSSSSESPRWWSFLLACAQWLLLLSSRQGPERLDLTSEAGEGKRLLSNADLWAPGGQGPAWLCAWQPVSVTHDTQACYPGSAGHTTGAAETDHSAQLHH